MNLLDAVPVELETTELSSALMGDDINISSLYRWECYE